MDVCSVFRGHCSRCSQSLFPQHDKSRDIDFYQVTAACDYLGKSSKQGRRSREVKGLNTVAETVYLEDGCYDL